MNNQMISDLMMEEELQKAMKFLEQPLEKENATETFLPEQSPTLSALSLVKMQPIDLQDYLLYYLPIFCCYDLYGFKGCYPLTIN